MASVNWITGEITILKSDPAMTLTVVGPPDFYVLDSNLLRLDLKDLEDDPDGRPWPRTHDHNLPYTISGIEYDRAFVIIPPYFITFEDDQYRVIIDASNNNILDVATANQVGIATNNSAGRTIVQSEGTFTAQDRTDLGLARDNARAANQQTKVP